MKLHGCAIAGTLAAILACLSGLPAHAAHEPATEKDDEHDFVPLFDGKTLNGWHAVPSDSSTDWMVQNGTIVGRGSAKRLSYLVWKEEVRDFELHFQYRMATDGNSGVEIRGRKDVTGKRPFEGYHADFGHVGIGPHVLGAWDFHFARRREPPCPRGTQLVIRKDGSFESSRIEKALTRDDIRKRDWNDVEVTAQGNHFLFTINGKPAAEFTDNAKDRLKHGIIGLQLHEKGMQVEFRNLRLRK